MFIEEENRAGTEKVAQGALALTTRSAEQTMRLGRALGRMLEGGMVVALTGDLGAGKTVFVKGIATGLGIRDEREVTSPSFVLVNEYSGRLPIYHVDLYRLEGTEEVEALGWEELAYGGGVALVEWAEKVSSRLPAERVDVRIQWLGEEARIITFCGKGRKAQEMIAQLGKEWMKEE